MSKKILLIESDSHFAREMAGALEQKGFETRVTADGKEGLDQARDERPDAVVLCVELPKMSGYSICNKLKKDEALKSIPLVIISAEATPETFEQHKKLKTRAEDYLIKPFAPAELVARIAGLTGLPDAPASEEEVVTLADVELDALGGSSPEAAPPLGAGPRAAVPDDDEDLKLLDDAFESISSLEPGAGEKAQPVRKELRVVEKAASPASSGAAAEDEEIPTGSDERLGDREDMELGGLYSTGVDEELAPAPLDERPLPAGAVRGASTHFLRSAGIPLLDTEEPPSASPSLSAAPGGARAAPAPERSRALEEAQRELETSRGRIAQQETELRRLRERIAEMEERLGAAEKEIRERDAELQSTRQQLEADLEASRDESRRAGERSRAAEDDLTAARQRAEEAERAVGDKAAEAAAALGKLEALEQELEGFRTELAATRAAAEARSGVDSRTEELQNRVQELEVTNAKNEERVVKAYQKIKGDEKLREKTRKALTIALQLLDEHGPSIEIEKDRSGVRD